MTSMSLDTQPATIIHNQKPSHSFFRKYLRPFFGSWIAWSLIVIIVGLGFFYFVIKSLSPIAIAYPVSDHYHFRMQLIIDGKAEDFSKDEYQLSYAKGQCGLDLTNEPIHFHDFRDQIVHIHWAGRSNDPIEKFFTGNTKTGGITGGQVLKNYGLNLIGGSDDLLGYRLDRLFEFPPKIQPVYRLGKIIPDIPLNNRFWIYTGDKLEDGKVEYRARNWEAFLWSSTEDFFGKESLIRRQKRELEQSGEATSNNPTKFLADILGSPKVLAHGDGDGHDKIGTPIKDIEDQAKTKTNVVPTSNLINPVASDTTATLSNQALDKTELETINNLLGNVVIFSQAQEPTDAQVTERFNNLVALDNSTCGG